MLGFAYDQIRRRTTPQMRQWLKSQRWFMPVLPLIFGSQIYSKSYYEQIEQFELASVEVISRWIKDTLDPASVIDVGCGPGHMMGALQKAGVRVLGLDYSKAAEAFVTAKGMPFQHFNLLEQHGLPGAPWDLVVCCEVAEHLEARHADVFLDNLASGGNTIFLTAAEPGGGGLNHVNEQPNSYWIERLERRGFALEAELTERARRCFREHDVVHYLAKPMIFRGTMVQTRLT